MEHLHVFSVVDSSTPVLKSSYIVNTVYLGVFMHRTKIIFLGIVIGISFLLAVFFIVPVANFPTPTGAYGVGQIQYHWVDHSRKEINAQDSAHPYREIMVYVYYPTQKTKEFFYRSDSEIIDNSIQSLAKLTSLPSWLFGSMKFIKTYAQQNAQIAKNSAGFPVIIFSPGGALIVQDYSWLLEDLASHGFVVVGINHPYVSKMVRFPDSRIIKSDFGGKKQDAKKWKTEHVAIDALDVGFAINEMEKLSARHDPIWSAVDLKKIGLMGHSIGGRTTVRAVRTDNRIICGCNLDGGIEQEDLAMPWAKPFLFIIAGNSHLWNKNNPHHPKKIVPGLDPVLELEAIKQFVQSAGPNVRILVIENAGHSFASNLPLLLNMTLFTRLLSLYIYFYLELPASQAAILLTNAVIPVIIDFFDRELR
jgi:dienelactone hydrolase